MSNIATGGFSTKNNSLAYWNDIPQIQYIIIFFMILAGTNYLLIYSALLGKFKTFYNTEFIWYLTVISIFVIVTSFVLFINVDLSTSNVNHPEIYGRLESSLGMHFSKL